MKYKAGDTVRVVKGHYEGWVGRVIQVELIIGLYHVQFIKEVGIFTANLLELVESSNQITLDVDDLDYDQVQKLMKFFDKLKKEK